MNQLHIDSDRPPGSDETFTAALFSSSFSIFFFDTNLYFSRKMTLILQGVMRLSLQLLVLESILLWAALTTLCLRFL